MSRYWVSWWALPQHVADGSPWPIWITGKRADNRRSLCAIIDAPSTDDVWSEVEEFFPDNERRFIIEKSADWKPNSDRFP